MSILLSEGGYGCVYYPGISCSGKSTHDKQLVSKLQKNNFTARNEINIGKIITKINNYDKYFLPIEKNCDLDLSVLDHDLKDKCNIIKKSKTSDFTLMHMTYIKNIELIDLITTINNKYLKKKTFSHIITMYGDLNQALQELQRHHVVHFDLKIQNILFNNTTERPIIIDFGISFSAKHIKSRLKDYFYRFDPTYYVWPLEVHVINFLVNVKKTTLIEEDAIMIANAYSADSFMKKFSPEVVEHFKRGCVRQVQKYVGIPTEKLIKKLLSYHTTWDNYAINIMFILFFSTIFKKGHHYNKMIIQFSQILVINSAPNPEIRLSLEDTKSHFHNLWYTNDSVSAFQDLLTDIS